MGIATERLYIALKSSLGIFSLGVIFAGIVTALLYHGCDGLLQCWRADTEKFYKDEITYDELCSNDKNRFQKLSNPDWALRVSYSSFGCFIIGCCSTLIGFIFGN